MRRTTICRSNCPVAASFALGLVAAAAAVTAPLAGQTSQLPERITVERGNTLWGLAEQYFGDPLLWPAIYRLNTDVIEDPHWIYPGEVLRLAGTETPTVAVAADTTQLADTTKAVDTTVVAEVVPAPPLEAQPTVFARRQRNLERARHELTALSNPPYRPLRRGEYYGAGFLTDGDDLPFGRVIGNIEPEAIPTRSARSSATPFERIAVTPPDGAAYQAGDAIWIVRVGREVEGHGRVVFPAGIAQVVGLDGDRAIAEVSENFARIRQDLSVLPLEPFPDPGSARAFAVEDGITALVIDRRDADPLVGPQSVVFLDKGRTDGLSLGDVFAFIRPGAAGEDESTVGEQLMGAAMVVYLRERTASLLMLMVDQPDIRPGTVARLIRKMPG